MLSTAMKTILAAFLLAGAATASEYHYMNGFADVVIRTRKQAEAGATQASIRTECYEYFVKLLNDGYITAAEYSKFTHEFERYLSYTFPPPVAKKPLSIPQRDPVVDAIEDNTRAVQQMNANIMMNGGCSHRR